MIKGTIDFEYEPSAGTRLRLTVPLPDDVAAQAWTYGATTMTQSYFAAAEPFVKFPIGCHMVVETAVHEYQEGLHMIRIEARVVP